jgi:hypothetical protein
MPYKDPSEQTAAMRRIHAHRLELIRKAKLAYGIPLDRRKKEP